jgi:hypothetical protein
LVREFFLISIWGWFGSGEQAMAETNAKDAEGKREGRGGGRVVAGRATAVKSNGKGRSGSSASRRMTTLKKDDNFEKKDAISKGG